MPSLAHKLWKFATEEPPEAPEMMEHARDLLDWAAMRHHKRFLIWLREQADRPIDPRSPHADLIVSNARANTFKEIRQFLIDEHERAHQALEMEDGR